MSERPRLVLMVVRAESFPDGVAAAFERLESRLPALRGRKFYGVVFEHPDGVEYLAGVVPESETEASALGLQSLSIPPGLWVRARLRGWERDPGQIPVIVDSLVGKYGIDSSRPVLEHYRSRTELDILVPVEAPDKQRDLQATGAGPRG